MPLLNKVVIVTLLGALLAGAAPGTPREELSEYQLKAAFLLNFARFVEWPSNSGTTDPLVIGIFGRNPFGTALDQVINGKTINGRPLIVRRISDPSGLQACNLIFFPEPDSQRFGEAANKLANLMVLTVGESDGFAARGGMINFVVKDGRVLFEVNPSAASRAGIKFSSKLLQLAIIVKDGAKAK